MYAIGGATPRAWCRAAWMGMVPCRSVSTEATSSSPAVASSSPALSPLLLMRLCEWLRLCLAAQVATSTEATGGLSPLSSCVDQIEWMRLYLRGRMTDGCGTQSTRKGMGLVRKRSVSSQKIIHHHGDSAVVCAVGGCFKSWKGL